jgi:hypothetical protein
VAPQFGLNSSDEPTVLGQYALFENDHDELSVMLADGKPVRVTRADANDAAKQTRFPLELAWGEADSILRALADRPKLYRPRNMREYLREQFVSALASLEAAASRGAATVARGKAAMVLAGSSQPGRSSPNAKVGSFLFGKEIVYDRDVYAITDMLNAEFAATGVSLADTDTRAAFKAAFGQNDKSSASVEKWLRQVLQNRVDDAKAETFIDWTAWAAAYDRIDQTDPKWRKAVKDEIRWFDQRFTSYAQQLNDPRAWKPTDLLSPPFSTALEARQWNRLHGDAVAALVAGWGVADHRYVCLLACLGEHVLDGGRSADGNARQLTDLARFMDLRFVITATAYEAPGDNWDTLRYRIEAKFDADVPHAGRPYQPQRTPAPELV